MHPSRRSTPRSVLVVVVTTLVMILVACEGGGSDNNKPLPTATLTAQPPFITLGEQSTLTWSCTNANSCDGIRFDTGGKMSGTVSVSPSKTTTYGLTAGGPGGSAMTGTNVNVEAP